MMERISLSHKVVMKKELHLLGVEPLCSIDPLDGLHASGAKYTKAVCLSVVYKFQQ